MIWTMREMSKNQATVLLNGKVTELKISKPHIHRRDHNRQSLGFYLQSCFVHNVDEIKIKTEIEASTCSFNIPIDFTCRVTCTLRFFNQNIKGGYHS